VLLQQQSLLLQELKRRDFSERIFGFKKFTLDNPTVTSV
jgi:hypothetical protein